MTVDQQALATPGPLSGVRVVDFTWMVAAPFATSILSSLGAEVIKVESRGRLDALRRLSGGMSIPAGDVDSSPYFAQLNNNKLGVQLNLKTPEGINLAKRLIEKSHAVVEGYRGGVMERLGLGYDALRVTNEQLIMLSLSTNGSGGPDAGAPGYAPIFAAASGLGIRTGYRDGPPTELRVSVDVRVGYGAALALLGAIYRWRRTGIGGHIDFSATECVTSLAGEGLIEYQITGTPPVRAGNDEPGMAPHDCYRCQGDDEWVSIAVTNDDEWRTFCAATGLDGLAKDSRFADRAERWANREALRPLIEFWTGARSARYVTDALQSVGIASSPSATYSDLLADDHLNSRGLFGRTAHSLLPQGAVIVRQPWKITPDRTPALEPAPKLGQHNQYVFGDLLGLSDREIADGVSNGIIE
jgi:benzylsuccinate CoA-transferase BbsF subunit